MGDTVIGVDIGSASIRAVEVKGFATAKPTIVKTAEAPLPEGAVRRGEVVEVATVATALKRLWSTAGFKVKDVVLGVGGQRVFARDLQVPHGTLDQIRESLPFQVQDLLPVPVSDVLLDFYPISEDEGENGRVINGLLVAALKETVTTNVQSVIGAGLNPVHVDLIPFAVSRAVAPVRSARGRDVIVELGANSTNIVVVTDGVPDFVRMIASGSDDITRAIASRLQWPPEHAEAAKRALGMGTTTTVRTEDRPVLEIIYEVVGELLASVRNTLSYYASTKPEAPVQRILLTGGGALMAGVPNALADLTGLPVGIADPLSSAARAKDGRSGPGDTIFGTAYGLALGAHA